MTLEQFAERVGVTPRAVQRWLADGRLTPHRFGPMLMFTESDIFEAAAIRNGMSRGRRSDLERPEGVAPLADYVDVETAATLLGVTTRTVRRRVEAGELRAWRTALSPLSLLRADVYAAAAAAEPARRAS